MYGHLAGSAGRRENAEVFRLDPDTLEITRVSQPDALIGGSFSLARDGRTVAFLAGSPTAVPEIFVSAPASFAPRALTRMGEEVAGFVLGSREVISWKSQDGTPIEGVLIKPADFDPAKKHPLLCVIHGGPTGVDRPVLLQPDARYYPADIWAARGALVLKVNYRGSAGYGERFRRLNMRNLGVGDAWDVLWGIDHQVAKGWADPARLGCMGWSQGVGILVSGPTRGYQRVIPLIEDIVGPGVRVIDPAPAIARQVARLLEVNNLTTTADQQGSVRYLTSGDPDQLAALLPRLLGERGELRQVRWIDEKRVGIEFPG